MRYEHRLLIGVTAGIGKMGPQSQVITNRVSSVVGEQLGMEFLERDLIKQGDSVKSIWDTVNKELEIDNDAEIQETNGSVSITIKNCQVCPKKVGKYEIPATACPVPGIFKGICKKVGTEVGADMNLTPGAICKIELK